MHYMGMNDYLHEEEEEEDEDEGVKWLTHYSSNHSILLVGDGDFSFSLNLALAFESAFNIVATSLDSYDQVVSKYKNAKSNLRQLEHLGAHLLHGVDATEMKFHPYLIYRRFDRIIFNFPHAGFRGKEDNSRVIKLHRALIHGFFSNANTMLREDGEIHVNHKTTAPFSEWNLVELGSSNLLEIIECVKFNIEDYRIYKQKRGEGSRCDQPFPFGESSTFKFRLSPSLYKIHRKKSSVLSPFHNNPEFDYMESSLGRSSSQRLQFMPEFNRGSLYDRDSCVTEQHAHSMALHHDIGFFPEFDRRTCYGDSFGCNAGTAMMGCREPRSNFDRNLLLPYFDCANSLKLVREFGNLHVG